MEKTQRGPERSLLPRPRTGSPQPTRPEGPGPLPVRHLPPGRAKPAIQDRAKSSGCETIAEGVQPQPAILASAGAAYTANVPVEDDRCTAGSAHCARRQALQPYP